MHQRDQRLLRRCLLAPRIPPCAHARAARPPARPPPSRRHSFPARRPHPPAPPPFPRRPEAPQEEDEAAREIESAAAQSVCAGVRWRRARARRRPACAPGAARLAGGTGQGRNHPAWWTTTLMRPRRPAAAPAALGWPASAAGGGAFRFTTGRPVPPFTFFKSQSAPGVGRAEKRLAGSPVAARPHQPANKASHGWFGPGGRVAHAEVSQRGVLCV